MRLLILSQPASGLNRAVRKVSTARVIRTGDLGRRSDGLCRTPAAFPRRDYGFELFLIKPIACVANRVPRILYPSAE